MELLDSFKYEEQDGKKYLVYTKRETDILDTFTLEMLANNIIEGLAAFSSIRLDNDIKMKYNVTGMITLREVLSSIIGKEKFLDILEKITQAVIRAEDYMLDMSSYIFDESFIYVNPANSKIFMIVLPIKREKEKAEIFFKKLLFDVKYDQTEDCSYVASLMNCLGNESTFSIHSFRDYIITYKKNSLPKKSTDLIKKEILKSPILYGNESTKQNSIGKEVTPSVGHEKEILSNIYHTRNNIVSPAIEHGAHSLEKQRNLDIVFSDYEDEPEKKKKGFFVKKEKKEKMAFFKKKKDKKENSTSNENNQAKSPLEGIAIPGIDLLGKLQKELRENEKSASQINLLGQQIPIPVQHVDVNQRVAKQQDFGETVYMGEEEVPTEFEEEKETRQNFVLYRCNTQETFEIKGDVVRVGRSPSISEICILGNRGVGRLHAVLYVKGGQVYILDNNSKNKTYVDGKELKPDQPVMLLSGSKIRLGTEEFEFRISR